MKITMPPICDSGREVTRIALLLLFFCSFAAPLQAATFNATGKVYRLAALSGDLAYDDLLLIDGFASAGNCNVGSEGLVYLRLKDNSKGERQFSMALAARLADKQVDINVSDTNVDSSGNCYLRWIRLSD